MDVMPLTLLLDLDETLLDSNIDVFVPAYLKKLAGFLANRVDPQRLIKELLFGRSLMFQNERPDLTLDDVFSRHFYPTLGVDRAELKPELDRFYADIFPSLKEICAPQPAAVEMVECAFKRGWRVVIATNPVFPRETIEHRLRWANLPPEKYPFALVTSMENSHFAKTVPAYYAEILGNLGWPAGPVVMVGDDPIKDIEAATKAGLPVFWIRPEGKSLPDISTLLSRRPPVGNASLALVPQGTILDFCGWIQTVNFDQLQPNLKTHEALISSLQSTPAVLDTLIRSLKPAEWTARAHKDEWALTEIFCHLRDLEAEVNLPRLEMLTTEENAFITGQDTDPWAKERDYIKQDGLIAFRDFVVTRIKLVEKLKSLSVEGWQRRARHTIFGPTHLQELVGFMAEHDRTHIQQAMALLAAIR